MATHSGVLAWRILGTEEPGVLPSMRSHRVGHDCTDLAAAAEVLLEKTPDLVVSLLLHLCSVVSWYPCPPLTFHE